MNPVVTARRFYLDWSVEVVNFIRQNQGVVKVDPGDIKQSSAKITEYVSSVHLATPVGLSVQWRIFQSRLLLDVVKDIEQFLCKVMPDMFFPFEAKRSYRR